MGLNTKLITFFVLSDVREYTHIWTTNIIIINICFLVISNIHLMTYNRVSCYKYWIFLLYHQGKSLTFFVPADSPIIFIHFPMLFYQYIYSIFYKIYSFFLMQIVGILPPCSIKNTYKSSSKGGPYCKSRYKRSLPKHKTQSTTCYLSIKSARWKHQRMLRCWADQVSILCSSMGEMLRLWNIFGCSSATSLESSDLSPSENRPA